MDQRHTQHNNSCASSPKGGHPSYYQRPRCDSRSASPKKDLRSDTPSLADSKNARVTKPKNFRTPLTCFFWHHTGDCKKPDNQCLYAHYHTGLVAEPPISYQGKAMGGATAKKVLGSINQREEEVALRHREIYDAEQRLDSAHAALNEREQAVYQREQVVVEREQAVVEREQAVVEREQAVVEREQAVYQREQAIYQSEQTFYQREQAVIERDTAVTARKQANHERDTAFVAFEEGMLRKLEEDYHGVAATVQQIRRAVSNAQRVLTRRREQVLYHENFSSSPQGARGQGRYGGSIAIDGAIGAMGGLSQQLSEAEVQLTNQIHNAIRIE
ncbi:hypothetical protein D6C78_06711 [Aureobasidium pullulans]|uniref:C3H1-type domain-containing protein n=1 Tax=Aureobasidium pullulans TaxID=5580 RepID=A0A4T0BQ43_AURPU|nr:hypothetical protein D6C78_06711 [Aureobasidium pullulans]